MKRNPVAALVMAGAALLVACSVSAQSSIDESRRTAIVQAIEKAGPAVLTVNVVEIQRQWVSDPFADSFFDFFFHRGMVREQPIESLGSGFLIDDEGHILTNYHVVENASRVSVTLPDGRDLDVEYVGGDPMADLAVLKAKGNDLPSVELGESADLMAGEWVIAIGNPFGALMNDPQPSVSVGVVSVPRRRVRPRGGGREALYQDMIQTDAAINPGNSGGPLVNAKGHVVGVNTFIFSTSGGSVGLGFAIPIDRAKRVVAELLKYGRRRSPWPGFECTDVESLNPYFLKEQDIRVEDGCLVLNILNRAPAYEAGLRPGDVVRAVNGKAVTNEGDLENAIWDLFVGDTARLEIDRHGGLMSLTFEIKEISRPERRFGR